MKRPEILIVTGTMAGKRFSVMPSGLRLGRSSSNDIPIPDEELSRNHCLFETVGESDIRITDLASANGTTVNGRPLGDSPVVLKPGDEIEVGSTLLRVVGDGEPAKKPAQPAAQPEKKPRSIAGFSVDLGLGRSQGDSAGTARRRSPVANVMWVVAVLVAVVAICLLLSSPSEDSAVVPQQPTVEIPKVSEVVYEKVEASLDGVFRYEVTVSPSGLIRAVIDDTKENRHPTMQPKTLGDAAKTELNEILSYETMSEINREVIGPDPEQQSVNSWRLKVVYTTKELSVRIVNAQEPESFRQVREKFEAFANNELGIRAIQYSREKLVSLAEDQIAVGKAKWDDRDVQHGNLFASLVAYREALFYLETIDPKPDCAQVARQGVDTVKTELDRRYNDQRFVVERAISLADWETAQRELEVLLEMVPDRKDDRNREATAKLMDVEKRLKGSKK